MRRGLLLILTCLALVACRDETVAGYGATNATWQLATLDNVPFTARATLQFGARGEITGDAPCNRYFGQQTAPYPWFSAENIGATRRACPALAQESTYLSALAEMTLSEISGDTLILSNDAGREMVFKATR